MQQQIEMVLKENQRRDFAGELGRLAAKGYRRLHFRQLLQKQRK
jgi:hypothetical protein